MMFRLEIETDNAAFEGGPLHEISEILGKLVREFRDDIGGAPGAISGRLRDTNGNAVGTWHYTPDEEV